ncbi:hypothetical protein MTO96_045619, partial [Rhipicephalus appendiculatus]
SAELEHKKALLSYAFGVEGLGIYLRAAEEETQPGTDRGTQNEASGTCKATLNFLYQCFDLQQDPAFVQAYFKSMRQRRVETTVPFIQNVKRQSKLCNFGAGADVMAFDLIVTGIASP